MKSPESRGFAPEIETETPELEPHEKLEAVELWENVVGTKGPAIENVAEASSAELRRWMRESLVENTRQMLREWGIQPSRFVLEEIESSSDSDRKAELQQKYIGGMLNQIRQKEEEIRETDNPPNSACVPTEMERVKNFNCFGATVIGESFLEDAGIDAELGYIPSHREGHLVNIVTLANGDEMVIDVNAKRMDAYDTRLIETGDFEVRELIDPEINIDNARHFLVMPSSELPGVILRVLESVKKRKQPNTKPFRERLGELLDRSTLSSVREKLFDDISKAEQNPVIAKEMQENRIRTGVSDFTEAYYDRLSDDDKFNIDRDFEFNVEGFLASAEDETYAAPDGASEATIKYMKFIARGMRELKKKSPEAYEKERQSQIAKIQKTLDARKEFQE